MGGVPRALRLCQRHRLAPVRGDYPRRTLAGLRPFQLRAVWHKCRRPRPCAKPSLCSGPRKPMIDATQNWDPRRPSGAPRRLPISRSPDRRVLSPQTGPRRVARLGGACAWPLAVGETSNGGRFRAALAVRPCATNLIQPDNLKWAALRLRPARCPIRRPGTFLPAYPRRGVRPSSSHLPRRVVATGLLEWIERQLLRDAWRTAVAVARWSCCGADDRIWAPAGCGLRPVVARRAIRHRSN